MRRLSIAFFASGAAALVYQIVWQRMLGMFAGSDTVSASLVVGAFLLGLGVGSLLGALVADRMSARGAILGFAACEIGIALFALASKAFLYDFLVGELAGVVVSTMATFFLCVLGLLAPTLLMGASLPLLARGAVSELETAAGRIGWLYGLNTVGAGVGALAGGWLVVGAIGFQGAIWLAAAANALAAALAVSLPAVDTADRPRAKSAGSAARDDMGGLSLPAWCALVFASGYVIVALEIVWIRFLGQVGQYHAYLFCTILGVFLLADGVGVAYGSRLVARLGDPRRAFYAAQAFGGALGVALLALLWSVSDAPWFSQFMAVDRGRFAGTPLLIAVACTILVVGPPSFVIGLTFPIVQRALQSDLSKVGARVGWAQLANIAGNAAGGLATGLLTLHLIGTGGTIRLMALVSAFFAAQWWLAAKGPSRAGAAAIAIALLAGAALFPTGSALWIPMHQAKSGAIVAEDRSGVAMFRPDATRAGPPAGPFFIQGHTQSQIPFLPIHVLLGAVGPLTHPDPKDVLVIGVGSGGTPFSAAANPETRTVRAVELVQPVYDVLGRYAAANPASPIAQFMGDPRIRREYGDGRRAIFQSAAQYDVIQADAILPESSHSGLLYSAEFLARVRDALKPGGLYVQWAPTARTVETFVSVFPHVVHVRPVSILIGSKTPVPFDPAALNARLAEPAVRAYLARSGSDLSGFAPMVAGPSPVWTPATTRRVRHGLITDTFPRDEYYLNNRPAGAFDVSPD